MIRSLLRFLESTASSVSPFVAAGARLLTRLRRFLAVRILTWPTFILLLTLAVLFGFQAIWIPPFGSGCWERRDVLHCRHTADNQPNAKYNVALPSGARFVDDPRPQSMLAVWPDNAALGMALGRWEDQSLLQLSNFDLRETVDEYTSEWAVRDPPTYTSADGVNMAIVGTEPCPFGDLSECQIGIMAGDRQGSTVWIYLPFYVPGSDGPISDLRSIVRQVEIES